TGGAGGAGAGAPSSEVTSAVDASHTRPKVVASVPSFLAKVKQGEVPPFALAVDGPRTNEGHVLDDVLLAKLLTVMRDPKKASLLSEVDAWLDASSFRDFTWRLFERWRPEGAHMKDKWLFRNL